MKAKPISERRALYRVVPGEEFSSMRHIVVGDPNAEGQREKRYTTLWVGPGPAYKEDVCIGYQLRFYGVGSSRKAEADGGNLQRSFFAGIAEQFVGPIQVIVERRDAFLEKLAKKI